ncbi:hypothetical protein WA158_000506 [Blastocystis sp. Blastoise]
MPCTKDKNEIRYCPRCQKKVRGLDHHCIWLNTCISRRTYPYFFAFIIDGILMLLVQTLYSGYILYKMFNEKYSPGYLILFVIYEATSAVILFCFCDLFYNQCKVLHSGYTTYGYLMNQRKIKPIKVIDNKEKAKELLMAQMKREVEAQQSTTQSVPSTSTLSSSPQTLPSVSQPTIQPQPSIQSQPTIQSQPQTNETINNTIPTITPSMPEQPSTIPLSTSITIETQNTTQNPINNSVSSSNSSSS